MKIPKGMTEKAVVEIIKTVAAKLASKFKFGFHEIDDIRQQACLEAIKGLEKYDGKRPLENFLWVHIHNRLCNFKRDNYERIEKPCIFCPFYDKLCKKSTNQCTEFSDKMECDKWAGWITRNEAKKNLTQSIGTEEFDLTSTQSNEQEVENTEMLALIDKHMPIEMRHDYNKMRYGVKIPKSRRVQIQAKVTEILSDYGYLE